MKTEPSDTPRTDAASITERELATARQVATASLIRERDAQEKLLAIVGMKSATWDHLIDRLQAAVATARQERDELREALKKYAKHHHICPADRVNGKRCLCGLDGALSRPAATEAAPESAPTSEWKEAVIDELVVAHILTKEHETNPRKAIQDAIAWNMQVALDPKVSSAAQKLKDAGHNEAIEAAAKVARDEWHYGVAAAINALRRPA